MFKYRLCLREEVANFSRNFKPCLRLQRGMTVREDGMLGFGLSHLAIAPPRVGT